MLQLIDVTKSYKTGDLVQKALDGVSISLRDCEFVAILGPSGSGKTTLLNIMGGLDRYDEGDLVINATSTKRYSDRDWDSYRNHSIGFVFQSYNLIPHQTILANVELALTISGVGRRERTERARKALEQVGLGEHLHKRPAQLSGGQMQRVAIARALVNDPDILLADEPTGALDTETSVQVMDLLKEVSKDRLVVMVTHNPELAQRYATRIVRLRDGRITDDSDPFEPDAQFLQEPTHRTMGRASMSTGTAFSLSFNNLRTKKARTLLTSFAGSIGIIGIALILSLSNGVNGYISREQQDTMNSYPITIEQQGVDLQSLMSTGQQAHAEALGEGSSDESSGHDLDAVYVDTTGYDMQSEMSTSFSENNLTAFKQYLDDPSSEIHQYLGENGIVYTYDTKYSIYSYDSDGTLLNTDGSTLSGSDSSSGTTFMTMSDLSGTSSTQDNPNFQQIVPGSDGSLVSQAVRDNYDLVYGSWPTSAEQVVIVLDKNNEISASALFDLGILPASEYDKVMDQVDDGQQVTLDTDSFSYEDICNQAFYLVPACDLYADDGDGTFSYVGDDPLKVRGLLDGAIKLQVSGIIRPADGADYTPLTSAVGYTQALTDLVIDHTDSSAVVQAQRENPDVNVLTGLAFDASDDSTKASEARRYFSGLSDSDKASLARSILSSGDYASLLTASGLMGGGAASAADSSLTAAADSTAADASATANAGDASDAGDIASKASAPTDASGASDAGGIATVRGLASMMGLASAGGAASGSSSGDSGSGSGATDSGATDSGATADAVSATMAAVGAGMGSGTSSASGASSLASLGDLSSMSDSQLAAMLDMMVDSASESQLASFYDTYVSAGSYDDNMTSFGAVDRGTPSQINIYVDSFKDKDGVTASIDAYNAGVDAQDQIVYTDYVGLITSSVTSIVNSITYVLIAFVGISLVVSSIMIGIITYISVLERTKEIGILRALGASRRNVSRVFNAETFIVGLLAGVLGIAVSEVLLVPINALIRSLSGLTDISAVLSPESALVLIALSVLLTLVSGLIPARQAARKDPVGALRSE